MIYHKEEFPIWQAMKKQRHRFAGEVAEAVEDARTGGYDEKCVLSCALRGALETFEYHTGHPLPDEDRDTTQRQALEVLEEGVAAGHGRSLFFAALIHLSNGDLAKAKACSDRISSCTDLSDDDKEEALDELKSYRPPPPRPAPMQGDEPDGSFYAGTSFKGFQMYLAAKDEPPATFEEAMKNASACAAHGHNDWKVPTSSELFAIYQNSDMRLQCTFNRESAYWTQENGDSRINELGSGYSESGKKYQDQGVQLPVRYIRFDKG